MTGHPVMKIGITAAVAQWQKLQVARPPLYRNTIPADPEVSWVPRDQKFTVEYKYIGFLVDFSHKLE